MEDKAVTEIWVTRLALTQGIFKESAKLHENSTMASYKPAGSCGSVFVHGDDFHLTEEAAIQCAYVQVMGTSNAVRIKRR